MDSTIFRDINAFKTPKKSQKLGIFGHKRSATVLWADFWHISIDVPGSLLNDFSLQTTSGHSDAERKPF
jgi:hypothetical protein